MNTTTESNALENAPLRNVETIAVLGEVERRPARGESRAHVATEASSTSIVATTTTTPPPTTQAVARCTINFAVELGEATEAAVDALRTFDRATSHIDLVVGADANVEIRFGGEWPDEAAPLGWTSPDRRQILINPDHPYANDLAVIHEIVSHELGHVFIGPQHVNDGSLLDPRLNGQVSLSDDDRAALGAVTCADLGYG